MGQRLFSCKIKEGGSTLGYRPLGCLSAKTSEAVHGGRMPIYLPLTGSAGFATFDLMFSCEEYTVLTLP